MKISQMRVILPFLSALLILTGCPALTPHDMMQTQVKQPEILSGFRESHHWSEQILEYNFQPDVRIHINAPSKNRLDIDKPTQLILYALPNGNSIEWTIGREESEDLNWHYFIQHIGAQTRRLREIMTDRNILVAYLEASSKSWPMWRQNHEDSDVLIRSIVKDVERRVLLPNISLTLSAHSGGGSFIFGYINASEDIPSVVNRICFLDANYGFSAKAGHGEKLLRWLQREQNNVLSVLAYDDREILYKGQKVIGPTGGTYRATFRMIDFFRGHLSQSIDHPSRDEQLIEINGLDGRLNILIHKNPENEILHTMLVGDMSGLIHTMTVGTEYEDETIFNGPVSYEKWKQL